MRIKQAHRTPDRHAEVLAISDQGVMREEVVEHAQAPAAIRDLFGLPSTHLTEVREQESSPWVAVWKHLHHKH